MLAADLNAFELEQVAQHATSGKGMLQGLFIHSPHQPKIVFGRRL